MIITDANLVGLPHYSLSLKAIDYLHKNKTELESVVSFFSNNTALNNIGFKNDKRAFQEFNKKINIFYSNI